MHRELRLISRPAFPSGEQIIAYYVEGNLVYFSAVTRYGQSSINQAEQIILAISKYAPVNWRDCIFYDIQTNSGYEGSPSGWYVVDRLEVQDSGGAPQVTGWHTLEGVHVDEWVDPEGKFRKDVLELFRKYIV